MNSALHYVLYNVWYNVHISDYRKTTVQGLDPVYQSVKMQPDYSVISHTRQFIFMLIFTFSTFNMQVNIHIFNI